MKATKYKIWLLPLALIILITPLTPWLDLSFSRYFFEVGKNSPGPFVSHPIYDVSYDYAVLPGQLVAAIALIALLFSYLFKKCRTWRPHAMYLVLTLAVGAGLITHVFFKDHWGRPRPKQVIEFGGQQQFRPYYQPNFFNQPEPSKSFPCGHCTMGFYFFTFIFMGRRFHRKKLLWAGIVLSTTLGLALGLTRIAQGGHFFSDVAVSAFFMWISAYVLDWLVYEELT